MPAFAPVDVHNLGDSYYQLGGGFVIPPKGFLRRQSIAHVSSLAQEDAKPKNGKPPRLAIVPAGEEVDLDRIMRVAGEQERAAQAAGEPQKVEAPPIGKLSEATAKESVEADQAKEELLKREFTRRPASFEKNEEEEPKPEPEPEPEPQPEPQPEEAPAEEPAEEPAEKPEEEPAPTEEEPKLGAFTTAEEAEQVGENELFKEIDKRNETDKRPRRRRLARKLRALDSD